MHLYTVQKSISYVRNKNKVLKISSDIFWDTVYYT